MFNANVFDFAGNFFLTIVRKKTKKIAEHKERNFHKMSVDALSERSNNTLPRLMHQATKQEYEMLGFILNLTCFEQTSMKKTWIQHS